MFKQATGSWVFTRAALGDAATLEVSNTDIAAIGAQTHAAICGAAVSQVRYLIVEHGRDPLGAAEVRTAIEDAVHNGLVDTAGCAQFTEGFIVALKR